MGWMHRGLVALAAVFAIALGSTATTGQGRSLAEHPAIQYATRPTADRVARLSETLARNERSLSRDARTSYLLPVLEALGVPVDSQLLVFSKTGAQRAYTGPHTPRALYFDQSVAVGYAPGAPAIEIAAHDPRQGVVFYALDQNAATPALTRQTSCLACHVSASTLDVPGFITRSHIVGDDGNVTAMPQFSSHDVDHHTPHPERWGGWFVTSENGAPPYSQMGHEGNITFSARGNTSNQVFVDWMNSDPEARGYPLPSSDIVGLLVFEHQMHAINLITRLGWESRVVSPDGGVNETVRRVAAELADYLLFTDEAPPAAALTPRPGFARSLESRVPKDRRGRSFAQLEVTSRLLRYPCSFMVYSEAFDALPPPAKTLVYRRMQDLLSGGAGYSARTTVTAADRQAVREILEETKPDFSTTLK